MRYQDEVYYDNYSESLPLSETTKTIIGLIFMFFVGVYVITFLKELSVTKSIKNAHEEGLAKLAVLLIMIPSYLVIVAIPIAFFYLLFKTIT